MNHGFFASHTSCRFLAVTLVALFVGSLSLPGSLQEARAHDPQDEVLEQIGVDEKPGSRIPLGGHFTDQAGKAVQLSGYFTDGPVILTLNYYSCPTLCPLVFRNLAQSVRKMKNLLPGRDFRIVTVSLDPEESLERTADKAAKTHIMLGAIPDPAKAWPFLMGRAAAIEELARSVGVRYAKVGKSDFAHPNVIIILTPDGRISRYLYGLEQDPQDLKLALIEASGGSIGGSKILNKALLYCFHYDPVGKKYVLLASRVMTGAMAGVFLLMLTLLVLLWKRDRPTT